MWINFLEIERLIHSLKTAIACVIGYLIARLIGFPADQWIVISIIVVMCAQIYVGGALQRSYLRFFGTAVGCLFATATILFTDSSYWSILATIAIAGFVFSYIATGKEKYTYMAQLGAVTTVIIMFGHPPSLSLAGMRFLEISLGIFIAAIVSQFVFPIHARTHLRRSQAFAISQIKELYNSVITTRFSNDNKIKPSSLDEKIVLSLIKQRQLAKDSAREPMGKPYDPEHFTRSLYCEREILRAINFMDLALSHIEDAKSVYPELSALGKFNDTVMNALDVLSNALRTKSYDTSHIHLPNIDELRSSIYAHTRFKDSSERLYINGFLFSAEVLIENLTELAQLNNIAFSTEPLPEKS